MSWGDQHYVRLRLSRWGRWGADAGPVMCQSIFGRLAVAGGCFAGSSPREMPEEIAQIDDIVGRADLDLKMALIDRYQRHCRWTEGAKDRGVSVDAFTRLVRRAERYVQSELF